MIEPVALQDFLSTFFAAAGVILGGACYAILYAWSRLTGESAWRSAAFVAYAVLVACVLLLMKTAHLDGHWRWLAAAMLVGYLVAPPAIFRLCMGTHTSGHAESQSITTKEKNP